MFLFYFIFRTLKMFYIILSCCKHRIWEHTQYNLYYFKSYPQICFMTFYFLWFHFMHSTSITFIFFCIMLPYHITMNFIYLYHHLWYTCKFQCEQRHWRDGTKHIKLICIFSQHIYICVCRVSLYLFIYIFIFWFRLLYKNLINTKKIIHETNTHFYFDKVSCVQSHAIYIILPSYKDHIMVNNLT